MRVALTLEMIKHLKIIDYISILVVGVFAGFYGACYLDYRPMSSAIETVLAADKSYLYERFIKAYQQQPATIGIWEGTNLISFLNSQPTVRLSPEERAEMLAVHSRLYILFLESGSTKGAAAEAEEAHKWFLTIATNQPSISSEEVVKRFLNRDRIKRNLGN
jgi:hypothetical protein